MYRLARSKPNLESFASKIMDAMIDNPSGGTIDIHGNVPEFGYMVGGLSWSLVAKPDMIDVYTVMDFLTAHAELITWPGVYFGWWKHEGKVHFDISERIDNQLLAQSIGRNRGEIAIWSVTAQREITL